MKTLIQNFPFLLIFFGAFLFLFNFLILFKGYSATFFAGLFLIVYFYLALILLFEVLLDFVMTWHLYHLTDAKSKKRVDFLIKLNHTLRKYFFTTYLLLSCLVPLLVALCFVIIE